MNALKKLMVALLLLIAMEGFGQSHPAIGYANTTPDGVWCLTAGCLSAYTTTTGMTGNRQNFIYSWYDYTNGGLQYTVTGDSTYQICNQLTDSLYCIIQNGAGVSDTTPSVGVYAIMPTQAMSAQYFDTVYSGSSSQYQIMISASVPGNMVTVFSNAPGFNNNFSTDFSTEITFDFAPAGTADSGDYQITMQDNRAACPFSITDLYVTVLDTSCHFTLGDTITAPTCAYNSGSVHLAASGGSAPYQYRNGLNGAWQTSYIFNNLSAGVDTFYARDAVGCSQTVIATITRSTTSGYPTVAPSSNGPVTLGGTLNLQANATGAVTSYTWIGPNGFTSTAANPSISNVSTAAGGDYHCTVSTGGTVGCNANGLVNVIVSGNNCNISLSDSVTSASACVGNAGSVIIYALSGTSPFQYSNGVNGSWQTANVFSGLSAGVDSFYVKDSTGCTALILATVGLSSTAAPAVHIAASYTSLCGSTVDTFRATPVSGGSPVYQWYKNGSTVGVNAALYIDTAMANGDSVWVVMMSSLACASPATATSAVMHISVNPPPPAPLITAHGFCLGQDSISIADYSGASQYDWYLNGSPVHHSYPDPPYTVAGGNGAGSDSTHLNFPSGICFDAAGYLYVADFQNNRVQKFPPGSTSATHGVTVAGGNGYGSAANQLYQPVAVYVDGSGNLYVCDQHNQRIQKFPAGSSSATNGVTVAGGHGIGTAGNQLNFPAGVVLDGSGNIYVSDRLNSRIQKFSAGSTSATNAVTVAGSNGVGSHANQLYLPANITLSASGDLYVADQGNDRVQKFPSGSTSATNGVTVAGGNGPGTAGNQLNYPSRVRFDLSGNMYVGDWGNQRVQMFPPGSINGVTVAAGFGTGGAANQTSGLADIFVGNSDIYIADQRNNRIQKWSFSIDSFYTPAAAGTYTASYTSAAGCVSVLSNPVVINSCTPDTVWPGDADNNRFVDNADLLAIGLGYDSTGPARTVRGIVWQGDAATDWGHYFTIYSPTVNFVHADCNGDSIINANDTTAILANFGDVHAKTDGYNGAWRSGVPSLRVTMYNDTVYAGDTMTTKFFLGDSSQPVSNIYGLAFTYHYDPIPVDSNSVSFAFLHNTWLGTDTNSISIHKTFLGAGVIKAAITGINHLSRTGYGQIALMRCIITTDNINGKDYSYYNDLCYISDITAIDAQGYTIPLNAGIDSNHVGYYPNGIREATAAHISIYPNPASGTVLLTAESAIKGVEITDILGQTVSSRQLSGRKSETIDISDLVAGIYTLHVATVNGSGTARLTVSR